MDSQKLPLARQEDIVIEDLSNETLIYDLKTHKAHCLNESADLIWKHCDGKTTVGEMKSMLQEKYHSSVNSDIIEYTIEKLGKANLLSEKNSKTTKSDISRRDLVKKIGIGAAILLPAVISMVAPEAAKALSCASAGKPCPNGQSDCCPGLNCTGPSNPKTCK